MGDIIKSLNIKLRLNNFIPLIQVWIIFLAEVAIRIEKLFPYLNINNNKAPGNIKTTSATAKNRNCWRQQKSYKSCLDGVLCQCHEIVYRHQEEFKNYSSIVKIFGYLNTSSDSIE